MRENSTITGLMAASLLLVAFGGAYAGTTVRAPAVAPITVDGDLAGWRGVPVVYLENGPRVTAIAHDDRFLYVTFRFSDLALARRVVRTGAIVWINGEGKHKAGFGLRYRGNQAAEDALAALGAVSSERPADMPEPPPAMRGAGRGPEGGPGPKRAPLGALEVLHNGLPDEVIAEGAKPDGPAAACRVADGVFAYEFRVPLALVAQGAAGANAKPGRLAVGFQMGGVTEAERKAMREQMGSMGRGGGGARGGFGGPGGGGPPFGGSERGVHGDETVWLDVELVAAPVAGSGSAQKK